MIQFRTIIAGSRDYELMQEQGIKMNNLKASFVGSVQMEEKALRVMSSFYRRFALKCLADPKVNFSALQTI
jgi:hypothetical protein